MTISQLYLRRDELAQELVMLRNEERLLHRRFMATTSGTLECHEANLACCDVQREYDAKRETMEQVKDEILKLTA